MTDHARPETLAERVRQAAARTVAAGSARVFYAWASGSPEPESADRRGEGIAEFAARRAHVSEVLMPVRDKQLADDVTGAGEEGGEEACAGLPHMLTDDRETVYDGANRYFQMGEVWTGFFLGDPDGPRTENDPLWPLDALFGAAENVTGLGHETVRGIAAAHARLSCDLARADAALPFGVTVPGGPYRRLRALPAEVWLDAEGRARRVAVQAAAHEPENSTWAVCELWDFGLPVTIKPPAPEELVHPREAPWSESG
jgi:hypothetical protein